ncbi:hypothetical protein CDD80_5058 [Ophiocordyceps camponoti-rufipedis]|uniref:LPXTG-motif cell wall anchor domain protein n=1 Tax=Ophiocordyceps camponoti-rufipedis TaxID=2004952 RepID=A0A2C5YVP9_9HYPO|nr:hypothetical protein CDD80_5058 [Ophiocordyceps camponoti-rufipedis]
MTPANPHCKPEPARLDPAAITGAGAANPPPFSGPQGSTTPPDPVEAAPSQIRRFAPAPVPCLCCCLTRPRPWSSASTGRLVSPGLPARLVDDALSRGQPRQLHRLVSSNCRSDRLACVCAVSSSFVPVVASFKLSRIGVIDSGSLGLSARRLHRLCQSASSRPYGLDGQHHGASDDATLRALEGRDAGHGSLDRLDDPADVFLRIAKDESMRRVHDESGQNSLYPSAGHRRPLSTVVQGHHAVTSPPRPRRRLSDYQDRPPSSHLSEGQAPESSRTATYRPLTRERTPSVHPAEDSPAGRTRTGSVGVRPSSLIARSPQVASQESNRDGSTYARRRASITDSRAPSRSSAYAASVVGIPPGKAYNSSQLARGSEPNSRPSPEQGPGVEGTDSTASTPGPCTVWDELDDIKSRIQRLELTGNLPSSSGTTGSRLSDERPATATTTVTSMSLSPKRLTGRSTEVMAPATSPKEAHGVLNSTLAKIKPLVSADVYRALDAAAQEAIGLSSLMGSPGLPGPISSGTSTIGSGNNVTDRQLRRRADGVCRSLTELCVALSEDLGAQPGSTQAVPSSALSQLDGPATPTLPRSYSGLQFPQRRSSIAVDTGVAKAASSPRALSRLEERRTNLMNGSSLASPRVSVSNGSDAGARSLAIGRTRKAVAEDADDGRSTILSRSRRAGTEEPDEGRKTSLLVRSRRGTVGAEAEDARFGAPSQLGLLRGVHSGLDHTQGSTPSPTDMSPRPSAGVTRRNMAPSTGLHTSRVATPAGYSSAPPRRYVDRSMVDRDASPTTMVRSVEDQPSRPPPLSQGISHLRASSLSGRRQAREGLTGSYR